MSGTQADHGATPGFRPGRDRIATTDPFSAIDDHVATAKEWVGQKADDARMARDITRGVMRGDLDLRGAPIEAYQAELLRRYAEHRVDDAVPEWAEGYTDPEQADTPVKAAISGTFTMVVTAAVTLIVGIYVFAQIASVMPTPENNALANATGTVKDTTGQAFTLGAVAIIVLVASVILALVMDFGGGGGNGNGGRM